MNTLQLIALVLEDAGNRVLRLDPATLAGLGALHGRVVCLTFTDLATSIYLQPSVFLRRLSETRIPHIDRYDFYP